MKNYYQREKKELLKVVKKDKYKNYVILYSVTLLVWILLVACSFFMGRLTWDEFIINIINSMIGILPSVLLFDILNEKLSRDFSNIEISNKITETLMSKPETLELFTRNQKKNFIYSTISSIVKDTDAAEMVNDNLKNYLIRGANYQIRKEYVYDFELDANLPFKYNEYFAHIEEYFYIQEKLRYRVKSIFPNKSNINKEYIKIGFVFDNQNLDSALREKKTIEEFSECIFRENIDIERDDIEKIKSLLNDHDKIQQLFKLDLQIDSCKGSLTDIVSYEEGFVCIFKVGHNISIEEHVVRIIFHMPRKWDSLFEIALVDPTKAPKISVSYSEDTMNVDMFSFLSKGDESSLEVAHEHFNGIYDISINNDWIYPISGAVFRVRKKKN